MIQLASLVSIPTDRAYDMEYFSMAGGHYLVVANTHSDATGLQDIDSVIYALQ